MVAAAKEEATVGVADDTPVPTAPAGGFTPATSFFVSFAPASGLGSAVAVPVVVVPGAVVVAAGPAAEEPVAVPAGDETVEDSPSTGTAFVTNEREASTMSVWKRILAWETDKDG